jgi:hypothetical protein
MRFASERGDSLELERADSGDEFDLLLLVRVRYHGFAAETDTWVARPAWLAFVQDLVILEERRQGQAKLEGTSPGELSIVVRSLDAAGHTGVGACPGVRVERSVLRGGRGYGGVPL